MRVPLVPLLGLSLSQLLPSGALAASPAPGHQPIAPPQGTFLLNGRPIQQVVIEQVSFLGDCPGEETREISGVSFLAAVPTAPYQRIVIQNQTTGGFTDREYDERRPSAQSFAISLGQGQRGSFLTLAPGLNSFSYQVNQRVQNLAVNRGYASLQVGVNRFSQNRSFQQIREDSYCSGEKIRSSRTPLNACPGGLITLERIGVCPGGRTTTLSLETVGSGGYRPGGGWSGGSGYRPGGSGSWGGNGWNGGYPTPR